MPDTNDRVLALLEELVELQKAANAAQRESLHKVEQFQAESRQRAEQAIGLQQAALVRQRWFVRVWLGLIVFVLACVLGLLWALARYLR